MTDYFVKTGGSDAADGLSFDTAFATITFGTDTVAAGGAGDRLFVDSGVKEVYSGGHHIVLAGTAAAPAYMISVDMDSGAATSGTDGDAFAYDPMPQTLTGGVLDFGLTVSAGSVRFGDEWIIRGVNFISGNNYCMPAKGSVPTTVLEDCLWGSAGDVTSLASIQATDTGASVVSKNCTVYVANAVNSTMAIDIRSGGTFQMWGGSVHSAYPAARTNFFHFMHTLGVRIACLGVDFTSLPATVDMMGTRTDVSAIQAVFHGCIFPTTPGFDGYASRSASDKVATYAVHYSGAGDLYEYYENSIDLGTVVESVTTYGSALRDGTDSYSVVMTGGANLITGVRALSTVLQELWLPANATIAIKTTSSLALTDADFWIDVHAPSASQGGMGVVQTTRAPVDSEATYATDGTPPWTAPQAEEQVISITMSGTQAGSHTIVANSAYSELDIYVDPEPVIT